MPHKGLLLCVNRPRPDRAGSCLEALRAVRSMQPFFGSRRLHPAGEIRRDLELKVYSCDYNGWADVPEEEREGIDAFEAVRPPLDTTPASGSLELRAYGFKPSYPATPLPHRKAA